MDHPLAGVVGAGATHRGDLTFRGRMRIDGEVIGDVRSDDLLEIGPDGRVEGRVDVAQALVGGRVEGVLVARERITLLDSARVRGRIETPWLDVRSGARIDAEVRVIRQAED